jgi:hypothetical protein
VRVPAAGCITCRHGSALHCYELWSLSIGNGHFQHLAERKPLNRSKQKFEQLITSVSPPSGLKFIMIGRGVSAPRIGEIYGSGSFFLVTSRASPQQIPRARAPHIIYQSTWFRPRRCLLGVLSIRLIPWGSNPPKIPHFWSVIGDSQLKRLRAYLCTGETYHDA